MTLLTWDFNFHVTNSIVEGLTHFPCGVSLFKNVNLICQCEGAFNTPNSGRRWAGDPEDRRAGVLGRVRERGRVTRRNDGYRLVHQVSSKVVGHGRAPAKRRVSSPLTATRSHRIFTAAILRIVYSFPLTGASVWIKNRANPWSVPVSRCCSVFGGHLPALRGCGSHVMMIHC